MYRKLILDNGIRLVTERIPTLKSVTIGIWVNVGSRDESPSQAGYSHFIEHMFFKGTATRSATDISRAIDALGGEMNAFTTRETTTYYIKVLDQHFSLALDLLADLFLRSRLGKKEIEKEKQVVLEEIRMVEDDPEDLVQELHVKLVMGRHPLSRPILGRESTIKQISRQALLEYIDTHYCPEEIVIAVAGNFDPRLLEKTVARTFGRYRNASPIASRTRWPPELDSGVTIKRKPLEQVHLCVGFKGVAAGHKDRYAAYALNSVLGGSVSSRLFQEIRERRGLSYSIYSFLSSYSDGGTITVYAGTQAREASQVLELIHREIRKLARDGIDSTELKRTKDQMKGSLMLSLESSQSRMNKLAQDELIAGNHTTMEDLIADINRVTEQQVFETAQMLFMQNQTALTGLGPFSARQVRELSTKFS